MQPLPSFVPAHAADPTQIVHLLVELAASTTYRWTTLDFPLHVLSNTWTPWPLEVSGIDSAQGDLENVTVSVGDTDATLALLDLGGAGLTGARVTIRQVWLDPTVAFSVLGTVVLFDGTIEQPTYTQEKATFKLRGPVFLQGRKFPSLLCGSTCPFVFKDWRCAYAGSDTTCEKTYTACTAKSTEQNKRFGGFRNIPPAGTKITWSNGSYRLG